MRLLFCSRIVIQDVTIIFSIKGRFYTLLSPPTSQAESGEGAKVILGKIQQ